jgi:small subunit ribosomal protein S9
MPIIKKTTTKIKKEIKVKKPRAAKEKEKGQEKSEEIKAPVLKVGRYFEAVGRRKTSIARVRLFSQGDRVFVVNGKILEQYFPGAELSGIARDALSKMNCLDKFRVQVLVRGGGIHSQAEAIRHGISRALILFSPDFKKRLKKAGFVTRDPRMRERKKFGLKRARRAPQWQKR